jgi:hypothetical protein
MRPTNTEAERVMHEWDDDSRDAGTRLQLDSLLQTDDKCAEFQQEEELDAAMPSASEDEKYYCLSLYFTRKQMLS